MGALGVSLGEALGRKRWPWVAFWVKKGAKKEPKIVKNPALVKMCVLQPPCSQNLVFAVPGGPEWEPKSFQNVVANRASKKVPLSRLQRSLARHQGFPRPKRVAQGVPKGFPNGIKNLGKCCLLTEAAKIHLGALGVSLGEALGCKSRLFVSQARYAQIRPDTPKIITDRPRYAQIVPDTPR